MKTYLEINEVLTMEELRTKQPLQVRVETADRDDALTKLPSLELFFTGRTYVKKIHYCNHETGGPCTEEIL